MSDEPKVGFTGETLYFDGTRVLPGPANTQQANYSVAPKTLASMAANQAAYFGEPEIPVTDEMIRAGEKAWQSVREFAQIGTNPRCTEATYRAMAARRPREGTQLATDQNVITLIRLLQTERDSARTLATEHGLRIAQLERDIRMLMSDKVGDHSYHGPVKDGEAVPDETHERFHKTVGDVLSGNVMRPARDQMEKALADAKAKDDKAPKPIRGITTRGDPRLMGWMLA
jgi:hypothetical protein